VVRDVANVLQSKQPHLWRAVAKVHEPFHVLLDVAPAMISEVWVLVMGFAVPIINTKSTKNILGAV